jgi:hypothetical protein
MTCMCAGSTALTVSSLDRDKGIRACSHQTASKRLARPTGNMLSSRHAGASSISRKVSRNNPQQSLRQRTRAVGLSVLAVAAEAETVQQPDAPASAGVDRQAAANALLELLSPDLGQHSSVAAEQLSSGAGVGLIATRDVPPGALLLAVPFSLVLETARDEARPCKHKQAALHQHCWRHSPCAVSCRQPACC